MPCKIIEKIKILNINKNNNYMEVFMNIFLKKVSLINAKFFLACLQPILNHRISKNIDVNMQQILLFQNNNHGLVMPHLSILQV